MKLQQRPKTRIIDKIKSKQFLVLKMVLKTIMEQFCSTKMLLIQYINTITKGLPSTTVHLSWEEVFQK